MCLGKYEISPFALSQLEGQVSVSLSDSNGQAEPWQEEEGKVNKLAWQLDPTWRQIFVSGTEEQRSQQHWSSTLKCRVLDYGCAAD